MKSVLRKHKTEMQRRKIRRAIWRAIVPVFVLATIGIVILLLPPLRITRVSVFGNNLVSKESIIRIADRVLHERVLKIFPRSNILLFRPLVLEEQIYKEFAHVASASITRSLNGELTIEINERDTWGIYCADSTLDCFYIATDGVLVENAPQITGGVIFRVVDMRSDAPALSIGEGVVTKDYTAHIHHVAAWLQDEYDLELREVVLGREFNDRLELYTNEGWYILIDENTDIARAVKDASLVLDQHITNRAELEYIDIRFEGKVFYRDISNTPNIEVGL